MQMHHCSNAKFFLAKYFFISWGNFDDDDDDDDLNKKIEKMHLWILRNDNQPDGIEHNGTQCIVNQGANLKVPSLAYKLPPLIKIINASLKLLPLGSGYHD